jgi:hypothetical protein
VCQMCRGRSATGNVSEGIGCVGLGRWFIKQILNCMIISTISAEMLKLTAISAVSAHGRYQCCDVAVGLA